MSAGSGQQPVFFHGGSVPSPEWAQFNRSMAGMTPVGSVNTIFDPRATGFEKGFAGAMLVAQIFPLLRLGGGAAQGGFVTLYHGTTRAAAMRIAGNGFKAGFDGAVFFAEDFATASEFAKMAAVERGATSAMVVRLQVPKNIAAALERGVIGEFRGAPFVDIAGGSGFEQILMREELTEFNSAMKSGVIAVSRAPVGGF